MSFWSKYTHDTLTVSLLLPSAWCDVEDVKNFQSRFQVSIYAQNVCRAPPIFLSVYVVVFLSKTIAAFSFDLNRKIHLLCFCTNANNTSSFSCMHTNTFMVLLICAYVWVRIYEGWFLCVNEGATHTKHGKFQFQNILVPRIWHQRTLTHTHTHSHALSNSIIRVQQQHFVREMLHCVHFNTIEMGVSMWQKQKIAYFIDRLGTVWVYCHNDSLLKRGIISRPITPAIAATATVEASKLNSNLLSFRWICRSTNFTCYRFVVWRHETRVCWHIPSTYTIDWN